MSKGTSHYNWQNWIFQTNFSKKETKNKKLLKEMDQRWINSIMPSVLAATERKNDNFELFFGNEGNRIVIPYDETKMVRLAALIRICTGLLVNDITSQEKRNAYQVKIFKAISKDPNFDLNKLSQAQREEFLDKIPRYMKNYQGILNYPHINVDTLNIRQNVVKQKFTPLGGGAPQEKDVIYYEPVIEYTIMTPLNPMMPQEVIEKELKDNPDQFGNSSYTSKSYTVTIGQVLQKYKETDLFNWWQQNQLKFSQDKETAEGSKEIIEKEGYGFNLDVKYLKEKFNESSNIESNFSILISRAPVDVLRMSDFSGMTSCHRENGEYFYCALAEARNQGAIAYLVNTEDINKVDLNGTEIFADPKRGIEGILPEARVRLRRITDNQTGVDFMVAEERTYGKSKASFVDTVNKWVTQKTSKIIMNDPTSNFDEGKFYIPESDTLELKGGSYSDSGVRRLAKNLVSVFDNASKLISQSDEEKDYLETMVYELGNSLDYGVPYTGKEDESETEAPCKTAEEGSSIITDNFDRKSNYATMSVQVECEDDDFEIDTINSQINIEFQLDYREERIQFNNERLIEVFSTAPYQRFQLISKYKEIFNNLLSGVDDYGTFNSSELDINIQLFTGPELYVQIRLLSSHPTFNDLDSYATYGAIRTLNKLDYEVDIRGSLINHLRNIGILQQPPVSKPEVQDMIQKFVEDLTATGSHMVWLDSEEGQWDQFILVENPVRETVQTNYPIIAKVPTPKPTATEAELAARNPITDKVLKKDMITQIIDAIRGFGSNILNQEFDKVFGDTHQTSVSYDNKQLGLKGFPGQIDKGDVSYYGGAVQSTPAMTTPSPIETVNVDITPVLNEAFEIQFVTITEDVQKAMQGADFFNVRLKLTVKINQYFRTEQEVINATNFIEKIGKEENYQKILEISQKVFNEQVMSRFKNQDSGTLFGRNATRTSKAIEKSAQEPNQPNPQEREVEGSLFSGNPMYKNQRLPENQNRKLVINERFRRLLRNIKK